MASNLGRRWKGKESSFDPLIENPVPTIYNIYTDPREARPTVDTWVVHAMLKTVAAFDESVKKDSLIPMGTLRTRMRRQSDERTVPGRPS